MKPPSLWYQNQRYHTHTQKKKKKNLQANITDEHQSSHSIISNSLWPHRAQHSRPSCPSPTPRVCSNSCPSSQWCHPTISSSVVPFSCLLSFPASTESGGQSIGASAPVFPMDIQDWFPLGFTSLISLLSKGHRYKNFEHKCKTSQQILAKQSQQYIKRIIHHFPVGLTPRWKDFSIYTDQSMWHTTSTNWRIKTIWSSQLLQKKLLKNSTCLYDKNSPESEYRRPHNKGHIWQTYS